MDRIGKGRQAKRLQHWHMDKYCACACVDSYAPPTLRYSIGVVVYYSVQSVVRKRLVGAHESYCSLCVRVCLCVTNLAPAYDVHNELVFAEGF